jgi:putative lipoprotein
MSLAFKAAALCLFICFAGPTSAARQAGSDRWFARDKYEHFAVSTFYSTGITIASHRHFNYGKDTSRVIGFSVTVSLGAAKELSDYKTPDGIPSLKDFVWDIAGTITGILIFGLTQ